MDHSRINTTTQNTTPTKVPLIPVQMEITSIKDVNSNSNQGEDLYGLKQEGLDGGEEEKVEGEFYDAFDQFLSNKEHVTTKPLIRQQGC